MLRLKSDSDRAKRGGNNLGGHRLLGTLRGTLGQYTRQYSCNCYFYSIQALTSSSQMKTIFVLSVPPSPPIGIRLTRAPDSPAREKAVSLKPRHVSISTKSAADRLALERDIDLSPTFHRESRFLLFLHFLFPLSGCPFFSPSDINLWC